MPIEDTQWKKGQSGNPKGRPKGISITELVKQELEKCPEGEDKTTYARLIIKRIFNKAIVEGDTIMLKTIWAYIDGLPKASMEFTNKSPVTKEELDAILLKADTSTPNT
jgi:hypothetical protein